jgi:ribonuclease P protein component
LIERISHRDSFRRLYEAGHVIRRGGMSCRWIPDPLLGHPRVAYALSRQVGSAVRRNRLRRQLRAIVNSRAQEIPSGWLLLSVSPKLSTASTEHLRQLFADILPQLTGSEAPMS